MLFTLGIWILNGGGFVSIFEILFYLSVNCRLKLGIQYFKKIGEIMFLESKSKLSALNYVTNITVNVTCIVINVLLLSISISLAIKTIWGGIL